MFHCLLCEKHFLIEKKDKNSLIYSKHVKEMNCLLVLSTSLTHHLNQSISLLLYALLFIKTLIDLYKQILP